jgi:hypothetical protein
MSTAVGVISGARFPSSLPNPNFFLQVSLPKRSSFVALLTFVGSCVFCCLLRPAGEYRSEPYITSLQLLSNMFKLSSYTFPSRIKAKRKSVRTSKRIARAIQRGVLARLY